MANQFCIELVSRMSVLLSCCEEGQTVTFLYVLSWELADNLWPVYVDIQVILRCSFPDRSEAEVNDCCFRGHSGWARCPFLNCWGSNLVVWLMFWSTAFTTMFWCLFLMVFGFWVVFMLKYLPQSWLSYSPLCCHFVSFASTMITVVINNKTYASQIPTYDDYQN